MAEIAIFAYMVKTFDLAKIAEIALITDMAGITELASWSEKDAAAMDDTIKKQTNATITFRPSLKTYILR